MATFYNIMFYGGLALAIIFAICAVVIFFVLKIPKAVGDVTGSSARKKIEEIREKGYESVQGAGASKKEAISKGTSRISVRDVKSEDSSARAEKGRTNYEKAIAELNKTHGGKAANAQTDRDDSEEATNILTEDDEEATNILTEDDEEATNVLADDADSEDSTDILADDVDSEVSTDILADDADSEGSTDILADDADSEDSTDVLMSDDEEATDILSGDFADDEEGETDVLMSDDGESTDVLRSDESGSAADTHKKGNSMRIIKDIVVVHTDESI